MKQVLGVAQRGTSGSWVLLSRSRSEDGINIDDTRTLDTESFTEVLRSGIEATGCKDVATVLWPDEAYLGYYEPQMTRNLSTRKLYRLTLSTAETMRFDRKRDDIRFTRGSDAVAFGFARAGAVNAVRSAIKESGGRLAALHAQSHALACVLPLDYEVAVYVDDKGAYTVLFISANATRIEICEDKEAVRSAILDATVQYYISGRLTPIAALDDEAYRLGDMHGLFEHRAVERVEMPHNLSGIGVVALGAGYAAYA